MNRLARYRWLVLAASLAASVVILRATSAVTPAQPSSSATIIPWNDPSLVNGEECAIIGPSWCETVFNVGGAFTTDSWEGVTHSRLLLDMDLTAVPQGTFLSVSGHGALAVDVMGENGVVVATVARTLLSPSNDWKIALSEIPRIGSIALCAANGTLQITRLAIDSQVSLSAAAPPSPDAGVSSAGSRGIGDTLALATNTNPIADTDGDGIDDATEIARGTDPNDPTSRNVVWYVDGASGDDTLDGRSATVAAGSNCGPFATIGAALTRALKADTVCITTGTYRERIDNEMMCLEVKLEEKSVVLIEAKE